MEKKSIFFTADNIELKRFKGISQFKGRLNGDSCLVVGSEAMGKSNFIQAIFMTLKQYPSAILRQDEEDGSAQVEISKGETKYTFKFSFEEGEPPKMKTLIEGERVTMARQAEIIKSLTPQTFDIDELINTTGKKQSEIILTAFGIDVSSEEKVYSEAFSERRLAKGLLEEASHFQVKTEVKETDTKVLREELSKANAENGVLRDAEVKLSSYKERLSELEEEAKALNKRVDEVQESIKKGEAYIKKTKKVDTTKLEEKLSTAEVTNEQARAYKDYLEKIKIKAEKQTVVAKKQTTLQNASKAIVDKINSKKLPVDGLVIEVNISESSGRVDSKLTYKGLPFDESSVNTAERLAIGARLQMSLYKPGNLAVVIINAGSVGDSTIQSISKECEKRGMQSIFELTSREDNVPLTIESVFKK